MWAAFNAAWPPCLWSVSLACILEETPRWLMEGLRPLEHVMPAALHASARTDVQFVAWWLGLGILSSIGVGCGLQSGLLFLFPFIFKCVRPIARRSPPRPRHRAR